MPVSARSLKAFLQKLPYNRDIADNTGDFPFFLDILSGLWHDAPMNQAGEARNLEKGSVGLPDMPGAATAYIADSHYR